MAPVSQKELDTVKKDLGDLKQDLAVLTQRVAVLTERVGTYTKVFIAAFLLSWTAIGFLITQYVPRLIDSTVKTQVQPANDNVTLLLENTPALLPQYLKAGKAQSVQQKLEIAKATIDNAEKQRITLSDDQLKSVFASLKELDIEQPETWNTALQLANYRTFVNYVDAGTPPLPKFSSNCSPGSSANLEFRENEVYNCTLELNGGFFEGNTFGNVTFIYKGAPILMRNNNFYDCKFQIANNENGRKFVDQLLSSPTPYIRIGKEQAPNF